MSINIGAALSQFVMPWLRDHYGYQVAFLFPAGLMTLALVIFAAGKRFYANEKIERKVVGRPEDLPADGRTVTGLPVTYKVVTPEEKAADRRLKVQTLGRIGSVFLHGHVLLGHLRPVGQHLDLLRRHVHGHDPGRDGHDGPERPPVAGDDREGYSAAPSFRMRADAIQAFNPVFIVLLVPISVAFFKARRGKGHDQDGRRVRPDRAEHGHHELRRVHRRGGTEGGPR